MLSRSLLLGATAALVAALPQGIDFDAVDSVPTPSVLGAPLAATIQSQVPSYSPSAAAQSAAAAVPTDPISSSTDDDSSDSKRSLTARKACDPQKAGAAPVTSPDTASAFLANANYTTIQANAPVPQGYQIVFQNLQGATQQNGYLGYYTLSSYDTVKCQQYCDKASSCQAFNVYIERDPSVEPGTGCDNPPSTVNYKCSLYGLPVSNATATNTGQWRANFQVVITASNGYVKNAPPPSYTDFTGPTEFGGAINAPIKNGQSSYIGVKVFPGPYDPGQCAAACEAQTQYDHDHPRSDGTYDPCNFFNSYILSKNNSPIGTYCSFYTQAWGKSYAVNTGQYDSNGIYYSVSSSYGYTLSPQDPGVVSSS
ncbi:hypothetical protein M409DRAFT_57053 [Zasmidium cellare ATCC 36951]|uniref:Apple domain-containing protein n=1 Tax=Zasmidium cellare ATCC 36951 TaxID=1080233 RepID=A0A6A6C9T1_ZASCE|nr:uncharacterized protein M409DRAFT_57053 [Zasmidium cellare ATCC 36951]KAF2163947.1 hypothetical protein M409DRAFT_57053 [Zasmidium cellare ATCC 36951]